MLVVCSDIHVLGSTLTSAEATWMQDLAWVFKNFPGVPLPHPPPAGLWPGAGRKRPRCWDPNLGPPQLFSRGCALCLTPRKHATPHMCYHTNFRRTRSNHMVVGRGPKFGDAGAPRRCEMGVDDPLETRCQLCYQPKFGYSRSIHTSVINGADLEKFGPSRLAFHGNSRSPKRTRIDRLPMTSY